MTKKIPKKILEAAPAIWRKFTPIEKRLWKSLFKEFRCSYNFPPKWGFKKDQYFRDVAAHNIACFVVWRLQKRKKDEKNQLTLKTI